MEIRPKMRKGIDLKEEQNDTQFHQTEKRTEENPERERERERKHN